jgi:hypothetical protein
MSLNVYWQFKGFHFGISDMYLLYFNQINPDHYLFFLCCLAHLLFNSLQCIMLLSSYTDTMFQLFSFSNIPFHLPLRITNIFSLYIYLCINIYTHTHIHINRCIYIRSSIDLYVLIKPWMVSLKCFDTGFHYAAQDSFDLAVLLLKPSECLNYRCASVSSGTTLGIPLAL